MLKSFKHKCQPHSIAKRPATTVATRRPPAACPREWHPDLAKRQIQSAERRGPRLRSGETAERRSGGSGRTAPQREVNRHACPCEGLFKVSFLRRLQQHGHTVKSDTFARESKHPPSNFP
jgi:hypothetical protein